MSEELKPCRKCGSTGALKEIDYDDEGEKSYYVLCDSSECEVETEYKVCSNDAIVDWNKGKTRDIWSSFVLEKKETAQETTNPF